MTPETFLGSNPNNDNAHLEAAQLREPVKLLIEAASVIEAEGVEHIDRQSTLKAIVEFCIYAPHIDYDNVSPGERLAEVIPYYEKVGKALGLDVVELNGVLRSSSEMWSSFPTEEREGIEDEVYFHLSKITTHVSTLIGSDDGFDPRVVELVNPLILRYNESSKEHKLDIRKVNRLSEILEKIPDHSFPAMVIMDMIRKKGLI